MKNELKPTRMYLIGLINAMKEDMVANQEMELAAALRDIADKVRGGLRLQTVEEWCLHLNKDIMPEECWVIEFTGKPGFYDE